MNTESSKRGFISSSIFIKINEYENFKNTGDATLIAFKIEEKYFKVEALSTINDDLFITKLGLRYVQFKFVSWDGWSCLL